MYFESRQVLSQCHIYCSMSEKCANGQKRRHSQIIVSPIIVTIKYQLHPVFVHYDQIMTQVIHNMEINTICPSSIIKKRRSTDRNKL